MYFPLVATIFAGAAMAAPLTQNPIPTESHDLVSFVARITKQRTVGAPIEVDNWVVASVHASAGQDNALLVLNSTEKSASNPFGLSPDRYVQNGTSTDIIYGNGYVERYPAGDFTYGISFSNFYGDGTNNSHFVGVNAGPGDKGAGVRYPYTGIAYPSDQPKLGYTNETDPSTRSYGSTFIVCDYKLYNEPVFQLFWHDETVTTPDNCTEVVLFAQCAGDITDYSTASSYHTVQKSPCYPDASWVPYIDPSSD